jgi:hypothetical protein
MKEYPLWDTVGVLITLFEITHLSIKTFPAVALKLRPSYDAALIPAAKRYVARLKVLVLLNILQLNIFAPLRAETAALQ